MLNLAPVLNKKIKYTCVYILTIVFVLPSSNTYTLLDIAFTAVAERRENLNTKKEKNVIMGLRQLILSWHFVFV